MYTNFHEDPQKNGKQNLELIRTSHVKESATASATVAQKRNDTYWRQNSVITRRTITLPQIVVDEPPTTPDLIQAVSITSSQKQANGNRLMPVALPKLYPQQDDVDACRIIRQALEKEVSPLLKTSKAKGKETVKNLLKYSRMIIRSLHPGKSWENNWTYLLLLKERLQQCQQVYLLEQETYKHLHDVCQLTRSPVKRVSVSAFELLEYISRMKIVRGIDVNDFTNKVNLLLVNSVFNNKPLERLKIYKTDDHPETVPTCLDAIGSGLKWLRSPALACLKESVRSNDANAVVVGLVKGCRSYNTFVRRTASYNLAHLVKNDCFPKQLRKLVATTGDILSQDSDLTVRTNGDVIACVVGAANDSATRHGSSEHKAR